MLHKNVRHFINLTLVAVMVAACKPANHQFNSQGANHDQLPAIIEEDLKPTYEETPETRYFQQPNRKIINPQAEIIVGQVKMSKVKMHYNTEDRLLEVTGTAKIYDEGKSEITSTQFELSGSHASDESIVNLRPLVPVKANSSEKAVVRAKALCLDVNSNDEFNCSHVVVDFFVAYKKQVFTQQMEVKKKLSPAQKPTVVTPAPAEPAAEHNEVSEETLEKEVIVENPGPNDASAEADLKTSPAEGVEASILGPYNGFTKTADLAELFADDEAKIVVPKPKPVIGKPSTPPPTQEKKPTPTPAKPPVAGPTTPAPAPQKVISPPGKLINKDFKQTHDGNVRPIMQAFHYSDAGYLRNATSLLSKQNSAEDKSFFAIADPSRNTYYGTYEMAEMISRLSERVNKTLTRKLYISSLSREKGGRLPPHASHQNGTDADIAYPTTLENVRFPVVAKTEYVSKSKAITRFYPSRFSVEKTYDLFKFAFSQADIEVERIFVDATVKKALCDYANAQGELKGKDKDLVQYMFQNLQHIRGHGDHFHLRLRCSSEDKGCQPKLYRINEGCPVK